MSAMVAGWTSFGGIASESPPRSNLPSLRMPSGKASMMWSRFPSALTAIWKFSIMAMRTAFSLSAIFT